MEILKTEAIAFPSNAIILSRKGYKIIRERICDRPIMTFSFDHIRDSGFEVALNQLIAYAETQAKLHQSLGDRDYWLFWVQAWANLQQASDAIAFPVDDQKCLEMWKEQFGEHSILDIGLGPGI